MKLEIKGVELIPIKENTSSSAYHVPQGILFRYGSNITDFDDSLLSNSYLPTDKISDLILADISS